jgi:hypothetical protein
LSELIRETPSEESVRLPEFNEADSVGIVMADGQKWFFRKPRIGLVFAINSETGLAESRFQSKGTTPNYADMWERFDNAPENSFIDRARYLIPMTLELLRMNYTFDDAHVPSLYQFDPDEKALLEMWNSLERLVYGIGEKKASDDGSE